MVTPNVFWFSFIHFPHANDGRSMIEIWQVGKSSCFCVRIIFSYRKLVERGAKQDPTRRRKIGLGKAPFT